MDVDMVVVVWLVVVVADCSLGVEGGKAIAEALEHVPNVTHLDLSGMWCDALRLGVLV